MFACGRNVPLRAGLSVETLVDALIVLYDECCNSSLRREKPVADFIRYVKPVVTSLKRLRLTRDDFELVKVIGRGAFGEVCVVRASFMQGTDTSTTASGAVSTTTGERVYAMKILNKWEMLKFEDRLPEDMAKFYIAEMVLAVQSVHVSGYVQSNVATYGKIMNHARSFHCPPPDEQAAQSHAWFTGLDWDTLREMQAPFVPDVSSPTDTSNFDVDDTDIRLSDLGRPAPLSPAKNATCQVSLQRYVPGQFTKLRARSVYNATCQVSVQRYVAEEVTQLKEELAAVSKRNADLEAQVRCFDQLSSGLVQTDKELKDALSQRKLAMTEYNEVTERLSELRQQKQKLSRQVRDKEEELEVAMQKIDVLRQDIRRSDKGRRELEARLDTAISEATKMQYKESLNQQQARYNAEVCALTEQVQEADAHRSALSREIADIIRWVADEKEARGYLQALATKMTEELDYLKHVYSHCFANRELVETRQRLDTLAHDMKRKDQHIRDMQARLDAPPHQQGNSFLDRPPSQMSYLDQFLKEAPTERHYDNVASINEQKMSPQYHRYRNTQHCCNAKDPSLGPAVPGKQKVHQFLVRTFSSPTKCNHCTSLMVPKPGGVKKGWMRQFVVVCDFKLFLYDISADRNALPALCVSQVLDMRDPHFSVAAVRDKSESEKTKWVVALSELHRILKRNNLPDKCVECVKLAESKGALAICGGPLHNNSHGFAVLCKKQNQYIVNVYEITRTAARRCRIAELRAPSAVHSVQLAGGKLILGYRGGFAAHALPDPRRPNMDQPALLNVFLSHSGARPLACACVPSSSDTLLVFNTLALYVDRHGHRARDPELMFTAHPSHHANARPLDESGWICAFGGANNGFPFTGESAPSIIYLRPLLAPGPLSVEHATQWGTNKRRFSVREQSHQAIEAHNRL
ncbi:Uncharacterized protein OBRU01_06735 [Operophtera brumata]|uniref:non-specific serine/threonine protein kinase n=1 Tax=Operophtera brumata TaxID=104452 RepID=A0A0L7LK93_OPEBR|nr:Uncharacterized protein OBRU01_06735 [Operophtera brumata]